jgi:NNP family nitrate/nitrite transporter-like MFS transporter
MLPSFFADTWALDATRAGIAASGFAVMNLAARPAGGLLSDLFGSRKRTLSFLLVGLMLGYLLLSTISSSWPWVAAVVACMVCSFFVQSGEGAVYAIVPLVKKRVSGQISGLAGAYGNVGAVTFLTAGLFVSPTTFFLIIAGAAAVALATSAFLVEPEGSFSEHLAVDTHAILEPDPAPAPA